MNRSIRSLDSSYSVACEGEDHDITNLAVRRRSLYRSLYPALDYPTLEHDTEAAETITRGMDFLPLPARCVSDHVTAKKQAWNEPRKVPRSNSDGDAATIQKTDYDAEAVTDHRRRRHEPDDDEEEMDCMSKSLTDHLPTKKQVQEVDRMSRSCSDGDKPAIRNTPDAPDHRRRRRNEDEYIGFSRCNTNPQAAATANAYDEDDDENDTIENEEGYELVNMGVGVRMPLIGTLSATKNAIREECLDGSSGSLLPETVLADCRRCKANLVCLFGMSCVKCQSCSAFSPVVYDKGDLVNGMVPYGLGIGLRLDKLVM